MIAAYPVWACRYEYLDRQLLSKESRPQQKIEILNVQKSRLKSVILIM